MSCNPLGILAGIETDRIEQFGDDFFAQIDGVTNALDNVMARESARLALAWVWT